MSRATSALRALIVCASGCITACYSDSPLDSQPQVELDKKLLGSWRCIPPDAEGETDDTALVALAPREGAAREYAITWTDPGKEPERYRGFLSTVQGGQVLNVETDPDPKASGRWVFVRYTFLKDNVVYAELLRDTVCRGEGSSRTPELARATLEKAMSGKDPAFEDWAVCVRKPS